MEAATIFFDPNIMIAQDFGHSKSEKRLVALGLTDIKRVLFVSFTFRRSNNHEKEIYRIISARTANKKERKVYFTKN